jgi:hypothetical protein
MDMIRTVSYVPEAIIFWDRPEVGGKADPAELVSTYPTIRVFTTRCLLGLDTAFVVQELLCIFRKVLCRFSVISSPGASPSHRSSLTQLCPFLTPHVYLGRLIVFHDTSTSTALIRTGMVPRRVLQHFSGLIFIVMKHVRCCEVLHIPMVQDDILWSPNFSS